MFAGCLYGLDLCLHYQLCAYSHHGRRDSQIARTRQWGMSMCVRLFMKCVFACVFVHWVPETYVVVTAIMQHTEYHVTNAVRALLPCNAIRDDELCFQV